MIFAMCSTRCGTWLGVGVRGGYDEANRRKESKVHVAVDTLDHLLALTVTPADQGDRDQVAPLAEQVQQITGSTVELAYVDQGYTGPNAADAAQQHGIRLEVVKHPSQTRLRAASAPKGRRTQLRQGRTLQTPGPGLRTTPANTQRNTIHRFAILITSRLIKLATS